MPAATRYENLVARLSDKSVSKHFDAYADITWNDPEYRIDLDDPRWELDSDYGLGATDWYQSLPQPTRARLGLHSIVSQMKLGVEFESVLSRGLLQFASTLPNGAPEHRYAYHEVIEEAQHSLMFQEFINRSSLEVRGMSSLEAFFSRRVPGLARRFPSLFFLFVLGGEAPIDRVQRRELEKRDRLHPLLRRIMQIHVTEEARHLCFAESYLLENVPKLGRVRRFQLSIRAPLILSVMARQMLEPPKQLVADYRIPKSVVREAYTHNPEHRRRVQDGLTSVRTLCHRIGLVRPRLWQATGLMPTENPRRADFEQASAVRALPGRGGVASPAAPLRRPPRARCPVPGIVRACPERWLQPLQT